MKSVFYKVNLTLDDGSIMHVGDLVLTGDRCAFRYSNEFNDSSHLFPIDPINLTPDKHAYEVNKVLFGVFEDSLPDAWGRSLMARRFALSHAAQSPHLLLQYLDYKAIGALSYELEGHMTYAAEEESIHSVVELAQAARAFEEGDMQDDVTLQRLFNAAGSPGGAHPKASVIGGDGLLKLVKFPSISDRYDITGLEASCLTLAGMAGMRVPGFSVMEEGGIKMLCLDRFDRIGEGCRHMISMQSLLNVSGFYHSTYVQMADVVRTVSSNPSGDLQALFRQMIFNAVIGNTDDHLKNFSMYYRDGYALTPAYDLLPDVNQNHAHTLSFDHSDVGPRRSEATGTLAARFKINTSMAAQIVDEVVEIVATNWRAICMQHDVPVAEINHFNLYIERQVNKLTAGMGAS
ncbi:type II toxin-antitoxin system HipA family toxin [Mariprofundus sp. EBB-1]|uniref:type II toxin-antitoxin system HipA family toxin n=1 Tax=Mariprofundus sp. EBB-1 TaxID=2650971 RepID=UPI000EF25B75|nr:type II toxin-antitoxin system HipA family toxin [Mariprofundus sp. EBB-1]RLL52225.1 type II toxin-antitoxin system HipA family toxin [Mariprofundus sp. EBB-1]